MRVENGLHLPYCFSESRHVVSDSAILVINAGSSSLKFGIYIEVNRNEHLLLSGVADGIGRIGGTLALLDGDKRTLRSEKHTFATQGEAFSEAAHWIAESFQGRICAIGHRVVHGGPHLITHQRITPSVLQELRKCIHFAPLHVSLALQLIARAECTYPGIPQFACFDTVFHNKIPEVAARFPLPRELHTEGIRRYGFHGLSYESIIYQIDSRLPRRVVIAHLGSGASLTAVYEGISIDTTMGLTPTGGLPMASRSGDLDPGVLLYLLRSKYANTESLEALLNHDAGLKALSGGKTDMRDIEAAAAEGDQEARLAIEIFCMAIRKTVAAYAAVLGGLDLLVFTGGIGEHSARVRNDVCRGLTFLGIILDDLRNQSHHGTISADGSNIQVRVVPSQEDLMIARHCRAIMKEAGVSQ